MAWLPQELIRKKRDGGVLSEAEIASLVTGLVTGDLTEGQAAAFAMAVFFRGMTMAERVALTRAMAHSGRTMTWPGIDRPVVDKHSTGGVGDKVSLMLGPMAAACGLAVPMISGRGLGHTGGTLDKLQSIPGYDATPDHATFDRVVRSVGCAIIGQTSDLAPADRRLYAIRDVTATVESIDLITASILSKKLAAGLDGLVMDVKTGTGAFMARQEDAEALARSIATVATGAGTKTRAIITDMNQVLGLTAGNAVEVREAIDYLTGAVQEPRLHQVTLALTADMLVIGGLAADRAAGTAMLERALADGSAARTFQAMVTALGGPADLVAHPDRYLPQAPVVVPVPASADGVLVAEDCRAIGLAVVAMRGGRTAPADVIDPRVGFSGIRPLGTAVSRGEPLAFVHAVDADQAAMAVTLYQNAVTLGSHAPESAAPVGIAIDG
ncbi:MAG: thymidine phosphorylase [Alphaproteobacteria bacterium]|nr:thymidine phosphorylase [Alphaproteobacteria bacterium]